MQVVLCVDLDDDIGRKAGVATPIVGRQAVEDAAVALAGADPEDSDVNVLFDGIHALDQLSETDGEPVEVAAIAGSGSGGVAATRAVGREVERVIERLDAPPDDVQVIVVTDGAQDESVLPVIRSRVPVDGVRRVVVRQAQDLESTYYTIKQVLDDPETRGTLLVPLGILLLIYPLAVLANLLRIPGSTVFGLLSGLLGFYLLGRGLGLEERATGLLTDAREWLYTGRVTVITYAVAGALLVVGGLAAHEQVRTATGEATPAVMTLAALGYGAIRWIAAAAVTSSLGRIVDAYLSREFRWQYLNAPFYAVAIGIVIHAVSAYVLGHATLTAVGMALVGGTVLGLTSTLTFAIAESRIEQPGSPS